MTKIAANTVVVSASLNSVDNRPLTGEIIRASVSEGIEALAGAFYEPQVRRIADNGKAYPFDATLPAGVEDTGTETVVNRFAYVQAQLVDCLCWKLETMIESAAKRVADETASIQSMVRALNRGRGDEAMIERKADFLDQLEEQLAMLKVGYEAAQTARLEQLGSEYENKAMRDERAAEMVKARAGKPLSERLARFA